MTPDSSNVQSQSARTANYQAEEVLRFWFPSLPDGDRTAIVRQWQWWFRGGADAEIIQRFAPLMDQARGDELDAWSAQPRSRLALILILDQFSRSLYRGTAQAFAQDSKACMLTLTGIDAGHYAALESPWEKTFFFMPLGHSENLRHLEVVVTMADELLQDAPEEYRELLEFSAGQARRHREVIARFGRHSHRNEILGRQSTPAELEYLASGNLVHTPSFPPHLLGDFQKTKYPCRIGKAKCAHLKSLGEMGTLGFAHPTANL